MSIRTYILYTSEYVRNGLYASEASCYLWKVPNKLYSYINIEKIKTVFL